jgi:hypothetical protein
MATFQMAAGLLGGGNFGQAAARGLSAYSDTMGEATKAAAIKEERDYIKQQRELAAAKAQREESERLRIQQVLRGALGGATPQQAMGMGGQLGPTQARADTIGQRQPIDANSLLAQGVPFEQVKQLFEAQNLGRSKVARTIKGMGPDGREMEYQVDEFGQRVGDGMAQYRAPLSVNQGDRQTFVDPYSLKPQGSFGINETPDGRASRAVTMRGQNMTDARARERLAFDQGGGAEAGGAGQAALTRQFGKAPAGYRYTLDGNLEAIPGGPADVKNSAASVSRGRDASEALAVIAEAEKLIPLSTGSGIGAMVDATAGFFGASPKGAQAGARLKALEGLLVAKMPKMSGPQSDKDVLLYKQMAGQIGDTSIPEPTRMAALETIKQLQQQYGGQNDSQPPASQPLPSNPSASNLTRDTVYQTPRGPAKWDGMKFNLVK